MPTVFAVVGQHAADPDRLLLLGEDGRHYQYDPLREAPVPAEPSDAWVVDPDPPDLDELAG